MRGSAYVAAVCHANTYVADILAENQRSGVLTEGVHLRLDDDWQGGGIWRAERVDTPGRYPLSLVPALVPLGLGNAESSREPAIVEAFSAENQPIAASQTGFRITLTVRDRELGRLRLTAAAAEALAPGAVDVVVRHDDIRERFSVERDGTTLYGIRYPLKLHPGVVLSCNVESGGSVVRTRSHPVTPPVEAPDGKKFDHETNITVYEREMGLKALPLAQRRGAPSLAELINRAFRHRGRHLEGGCRALTLFDLATVIFGPAWQPENLRTIAESIAAMDLERRGVDYVWRPGVTRRTRSSDRSLLAAYGEARPRGRLARSVRRHWVPMHLRRYTKRRPSAPKRASYAEARRSFGEYGRLPEELPDGSTWVKPYSWGDHDGDPDNDEPQHPPMTTVPAADDSPAMAEFDHA